MRTSRGTTEKILELIDANEPQLIAFHGFLSEDGTEISSVQVHPDTTSMDFHMQVLKNNWDESFSKYGELLELIHVEYFGKPSKNTLKNLGCSIEKRRAGSS